MPKLFSNNYVNVAEERVKHGNAKQTRFQIILKPKIN